MVVDEQARVQKKTFTNWINSYLRKVSSISYSSYEFIDQSKRNAETLLQFYASG